MKLPLALPLLLLLQTTAIVVRAHTRLECPPPRSGRTGEKVGPCDAPDDLSLPAYPLIPGALNTITWLESIPHPGAPARFALSRDGDDSLDSFESCLLLDHVPHDEYSVPVFPDPTTWHRSSITLWIPDVYCERCHLQLMTVMSDEVHGVPEGTTCAYGGALETGRVTAELPACPVVYHSCAPVSINGTLPRNDLEECDTAEFEEELGWPMKPSDSSEGHYDYSTYFYKGDPGVYNLSTARLMMAGSPLENCPSTQFCDPAEHLDTVMVVPEDAKYTSMEGSCASMTGMEVERFETGILPSTPKNTSEPMAVPSGEADPCVLCVVMKPCYTDACALRNEATGNWTGPAAQCNQGGSFCEFCFTDSPCFGYGSDVVAVADEGTVNETMEEEEAVDEEAPREVPTTQSPEVDLSEESESSTGSSGSSVGGFLALLAAAFTGLAFL